MREELALRPRVGITCLQPGFTALSLAAQGSPGDTGMLFIFHITANLAHISVAIILCVINLYTWSNTFIPKMPERGTIPSARLSRRN